MGPRLYDPRLGRGGKGLQSAARQRRGVLTGSGILSVLRVLGRGSHASSSREIRKFLSARTPLPLPTWRRPTDSAAAPLARMRTVGVIRGDGGRGS